MVGVFEGGQAGVSDEDAVHTEFSLAGACVRACARAAILLHLHPCSRFIFSHWSSPARHNPPSCPCPSPHTFPHLTPPTLCPPGKFQAALSPRLSTEGVEEPMQCLAHILSTYPDLHPTPTPP